MDRQRIGKPSGTEDYHTQLLHAMGKLLPRAGLDLQSNDARVRWTPRRLVTTAILMCWQTAGTLRDAFGEARQIVIGMYRSRRRPGGSYSGFMEALARDSQRCLQRVTVCLRRAVQTTAGRHWRRDGWVLMGVDGSRIDCPRTVANEEALGCAGRNKTTPQVFLTSVYHVTSGLPWDFRRGRGDASERGHLLGMLENLPRKTMLLMDAGFTGYDFLRALRDSGHDFILRIGRNMRLLRKLGWQVDEHDGIVYQWPQSRRDEPPLVLRLVVLGDGRAPVYLVTSVLEPKLLSDGQIARWYRLRWGIEVFYRSLKQTLQRRKMRSVRPDNALTELDWNVIGLWVLGLMATRQIPHEQRWSVACSLRVVRRVLSRPHARGPKLHRQLRRAVQDTYVRRHDKSARNWPHKKNDPPPGPPRIRIATTSEIRKAKGLKQCA